MVKATKKMKHIEGIYIIAEAGINHNGSMDIAYKLIDAAVEANVDAIKFQTFNTEAEIAKGTEKAYYQKNNTDTSESLFDMTKNLELSSKDHDLLIDYCIKRGIAFLSSASDIPSLDLLIAKGQSVWKVPSNLITDYPYLKQVGALGEEIILSTGMSTLTEIKNALDLLIRMGTTKENITILHCNTDYPSNFEDINLRAMLTIKKTFGCRVGYSDHSVGIEVPIAAASMGAQIIEKHFTIDNTLKGPDHLASLEPDQLKKMVKAIRNIEIALGSSNKKPTKSELKNINITRKSIFCTKDIRKDEPFTEENLTTKRPGLGINPMRWESIIGQRAKRKFLEGDMVEL